MVASILWIFKEAAMKVIEEKHYVEGGPACGYKACAEMVCENGQAYHTVGKKYFGECTKCHGTGLLPVELWPDAVKAAWLAKNCRAPLIQPGDGENSNTVITTTDSHQRPYFLAEELNFSAALTAAVIAVTEEEK